MRGHAITLPELALIAGTRVALRGGLGWAWNGAPALRKLLASARGARPPRPNGRRSPRRRLDIKV